MRQKKKVPVYKKMLNAEKRRAKKDIEFDKKKAK
jgi:hypothetical protein